jgi:hypothetical protein
MCFIEPRMPADWIIRITWRADMHDKFKLTPGDVKMLLAAHPNVSVQGQAYIFFCTHHPVSKMGLMVLHRRRIVYSFLGFLSYFPIALGILGLTLILILAAFTGSYESLSERLAIAGGVILVSSLLFIGGLRAHSVAKRMALPSSLRAIGGPRIDIFHILKLPLTDSGT